MLTSGAAESAMKSPREAIRWWLDRARSIVYGVVYDDVDPRFGHDQRLQTEVRALVEAATPAHAARRDVRVLELACGAGNLTCVLAEAGFSVTGLDADASLVEVAKEKRRARHLANLTFRHGDLAAGSTFRDGSFDQVVSLHALSVHPAPQRLLGEAHRVLKPGGHAIFVNHTRRIGRWSTARQRIGPHDWDEDAFAAQLRRAGFAVLEIRRTFLGGDSLLAWARKGGKPE